MNAKELHRLMVAGRIVLADPTTGHPHMPADQEIAHRALSLLAAAEANDGTTPETDGAAGTVHNDLGDPIEVAPADFARRLERERNGLARAHAAALEENARLTKRADDAHGAIKTLTQIVFEWKGRAERAEAELAKLRQKLMRYEHAEAADILHPPQDEQARADFPERTK